MKVERYITEYASATRRAIKQNKLIDPGIKDELLYRIDCAVNARRDMVITADDAIMLIGGFQKRDEDMTQYRRRATS